MTEQPNDIICAVATAPGKAALAIVRISGPGAIGLTARLIPGLRDIGPESARRLIHDFARDPNGAAIDEVTAIPYFAPRSYTAEEMVEIICHGGYAASRAILSALDRLGARLAEPGEFTRRAFLNGRISLAEAEAVAAAIEAKSELALKAAARNLHGELYKEIDEVRQGLRDLLTLIEAEIDFSEEEIEKTPVSAIRVKLETQLSRARAILDSYDFGRGLNSGYKIAIVGRANVGKSSLLNALLRRERAIVTDIPGTTRDTLTEWIEINGFPILLTDTAGLRRSPDTVEAIGQERTRAEIERSELVLLVVDSSSGIAPEDEAIYQLIENRPVIAVANKIDLVSVKPETIRSRFPDRSVVFISALTGQGLDDLRAAIAHQLNIDSFALETALLATERQHGAMSRAHEALAQAVSEMEAGQSAEVIALYVRETLDHLGELVGETTTEEILNGIFSRFCVGK